MRAKRVFLIVLDSVGAGEMPDASAFGDAGASGADVWGQLEPMFTVAAIVIVIGMVIRVIYGLRDAN